jgi:hypothetical protein
MIHLRRLFERGGGRRARVNYRLAEAYRQVFTGNGGREDAEIVLTDLAASSGFYTVTTPDMTDAQVRDAEGQRRVMARVLRFLRMSAEEVRALEEAARQETIHNQTEGLI